MPQLETVETGVKKSMGFGFFMGMVLGLVIMVVLVMAWPQWFHLQKSQFVPTNVALYESERSTLDNPESLMARQARAASLASPFVGAYEPPVYNDNFDIMVSKGKQGETVFQGKVGDKVISQESMTNFEELEKLIHK